MSKYQFSPSEFGPEVAPLLESDRLMELGPGEPVDDVRPRLESLTAEALFAGQTLADPQNAACCLSALWLWFDYLDRSHTISQSIGTTEGSYWHGIMHRREPDASNAKYWYRRVGEHSIFPKLADYAATLESPVAQQLAAGWDPYRFIDHCEQSRGSDSDDETICRQLARAEWQMLFTHCWTKAVGG